MPVYFDTATLYSFSSLILLATLLALLAFFLFRVRHLQTTIRHLEDKIRDYERTKIDLQQLQVNLADRIAGQTQELAALFEVMILSSQSLEIDQLLEKSLTEIMAIVGVEAACIHRIDEASNDLQLVVYQGLDPVEQNTVTSLPRSWISTDKVLHLITDLAAVQPRPPVAIPGRRIYVGLPITLHQATVGLLSFYWNQPRSFSVEDLAFYSILANQLGITMENARLRQVSEESAIIQERQRLARDLHDSVNQSLHSLVLFSETANAVLEQNKLDRLRHYLAQLAESARQALKDMRLMLYELQPVPSMNDDLVELLTARLNTVERRAGIEAQLTLEGDISWPSVWNEQIFLIATEALNNALRHAQASALQISLCGHDNGLALEIVDNGRGFDQHQAFLGGMGLKNMTRRAEQLGGQLAIESRPGAGTHVRLRVQAEPSQPSA